MGRKNLLHFFTLRVSGGSEAAMHLEHFAGIKSSLNFFLIYIRVIPKVQGRTFACISRLFLVLALLDCLVCYPAPAPMELQYSLVLNWVNCQKMLPTFMLSLVSAVSCLCCSGWKAPSCHTGDGTSWKSVQIELGSRVSPSLWIFSSEGRMFEGTPDALKLCWVQRHVLFFECFTAFLGFFFFFYFTIFCRQLHFVLIVAVPDAALNSMCLSPVQSIYSTAVWFPCLALGRICFSNYKVNFFSLDTIQTANSNAHISPNAYDRFSV